MQIIYNGALGPNIKAGEIPFTAGVPTEVADAAIAASLLAKPHFTTAPAPPVVGAINESPVRVPAAKEA